MKLLNVANQRGDLAGAQLGAVDGRGGAGLHGRQHRRHRTAQTGEIVTAFEQESDFAVGEFVGEPE